MNGSTEQQLRDLFAADAAEAPDGLDLAAGAKGRVRRRRRTQSMLLAAAGVVVIAAGASSLNPPTRAQSPAVSAPAADLPDGAEPGSPLMEDAAQCVKAYSPEAIAENAFAFDGTVTGIGPARTGRTPERDMRSVTFRVHAWYRGGSGDTVVVDMPAFGGTGPSEVPPAYRIGTRLLVSGMPRWGGAPLADAIAWSCGFTRYYSRAVAAQWAAATE